MLSVPIVRHFEAHVDEKRKAHAEALASRLLQEQPHLAPSEALRPLLVRQLDEAPTLHLDDLTSIALIDRSGDVTYSEDRVRLRAGEGDLVASCSKPSADFERYCEDSLALGSVKWFHPAPLRDPKAVASACWADSGVRAELIDRLRAGAYRYLHPFIGNHAAWALAALLSEASSRHLQVIAPHPRLTRAVNDKNWFADVVTRLLGRVFVPHTHCAYSLTGLVPLLRHVATRSERIVMKIPDAAGGAGHLVVHAEEVTGHSGGELKRRLRERLERVDWRTGDAILVANWESQIAGAVSCQLWIQPGDDRTPVVEAVLEQLIEDATFFVGSLPADLPPGITQRFVDSAWLLGRLFQRLGYVGRCSFDAILVGEDPERCRLEFLECNGRWGGASMPMTLMNRLFGDWALQAYAARRYRAEGLEALRFGDLLDYFADELYRARTGRGDLILYSPNGLQSASSVDLIALGGTRRMALDAVLTKYPASLNHLAAATKRE